MSESIKPKGSIQANLLKSLLIGLPIWWLGAFVATSYRLWDDMNEMGDTQLVQMSRYLVGVSQSLPNSNQAHIINEQSLSALFDDVSLGDSDDDVLGFAVWSADGRLILADDNGESFDFLPQSHGFVDVHQGNFGERWRLFYIQDKKLGQMVAVGQNLENRQEIMLTAIISHVLPAMVGLMLFLIFVWWLVRRSFAPLDVVSQTLAHRKPSDTRPLEVAVPSEIYPLVVALNHWFVKVADALAREERFTADASHELKSPLTALKLQADLLEQQILVMALDEPSETKLYTISQHIKAGIERSNHLVGQLLTLAKLSPDNRLGDEAVMIDWQMLSDDVLSAVNLYARQKHSQLTRHICKTPMPLLGNVVLMEILLRNLLDNAIRYCPEGSVIDLQIGTDNVVVSDNGYGVSSEYLKRLSERFFRPAGQSEQGSGLGLSIVARIAKLHGLQVFFENRHRDGQVVGFCVRLEKCLTCGT